MDALDELKQEMPALKVAYLHYKYLWPLKTGLALDMIGKAKLTVAIECNYTGQFTKLFRQETGHQIKEVLNKYDGRPFYLEEVCKYISELKY